MALGILLGLPLVALAVVPVFFRERIVARIKSEVNQSVNARINWRSSGLSIFGDFPNLTLELNGLSVSGVGRFAKDTLASVNRLELVLDLGSVIRSVRGNGSIVIRSIDIERPVVALKVLEDGTANWDITKPSPASSTTSKPLAVTLKRFDISQARITLDDTQSLLIAALDNFRIGLTGDFAKDAFTLQTNAHADSVTVKFSGVPYLNHVRLDLSADVNANTNTNTYTFAKNEIRLNDLRLGFTGSMTAGKDNTALDVAFNAPRTEFRNILSLVPAIYAKDFDKLRTSGAVAVSGHVKGNYGKAAFPSFAVNAKVTNAAFQYPDLPLPARDIALDLAITNPGGHADSTVVKLDRFHAAIGQQPIDGAMVLRTPLSDPDVDLRLTGTIDLADVRKTVKLENVNDLAGKVDADFAVRTRMSYIDRKQYDRVAARGTIAVQGLALKSADLPRPLAIDEASLQFTPQRADLKSLSGKIGSSDLQLRGAIENLLPFALRGDALRGSATFASQHFNLDEWQSDDSLKVIPVPANIDFALQATVGELKYGKLTMTNAKGGVRVKDQRATLERFSMNTLGGELGVTGFYETVDIAKPKFDVDLQMKSVDIPSAFAALTTVQALAPVAKFAQGKVSTDLHLAGTLGQNMMPVLSVLDGKGALRTSELLVQGLPLLGKLADAVKINQLRSPTLDSLRASIEIHDGRMHVNPFNVRVGQSNLRVSGSHGIDQSLQYTLGLKVPRSELGADANRLIAGLVSRAGKTGLNLQTADAVELNIALGGTISSPTIQTNLGDVVASTAQNVKEAAQQTVEHKVDSLKQRADSVADEARKREAERLVAEAEKRAADIRAEAQKLAETVRREAASRADTLVAKASNPLAKAAARAAGDRVKKEANDRADQIVREADKRATDLVTEAKSKAAALAPS